MSAPFGMLLNLFVSSRIWLKKLVEPLYYTKYSELINKSDDLTHTPYNIDLPILKRFLSTVIPKTISVTCVSSNNSLNNDLQINKLAKYRFPKSDGTQYSQMKIL